MGDQRAIATATGAWVVVVGALCGYENTGIAVSSSGVDGVAAATAVFAATVPEDVVVASAAVTPVVSTAATAVAWVILTMRRRDALRSA